MKVKKCLALISGIVMLTVLPVQAEEDYPKAQNEDSTIQLHDESEGEMDSEHLNLSGQGLTSLDILETMDLPTVH